jgi:hypothetical protein
MPFENITRNGVSKNFEQVLTGLIEYLRPAELVLAIVGAKDGWDFQDYVSAITQEVGDAADSLYQRVADLDGMDKESAKDIPGRMPTLENRMSVMETKHDELLLIVSRLSETLNDLQLRK